MKDYFNILGVNKTASEDEIKKAYRGLAMKHHPDRGGDSNKFQEIEEAYRVLSDPNQRQQWEMQSQNPFAGGGHGGGGGFHFNFNGMDINEMFNGGGIDPFGVFRRQQRRNRDLRVSIVLDLASTLEKQSKNINVQHLNGRQQPLTIEIPRGARSGMQMKYTGHGDHTNQSAAPGDLYIEFQINPHHEFQVDGIDLIKSVSLDCFTAITGTEIIIGGLDGRQFSWTVPPGTQHGAKFKIQGQGLWALDQPVRGSIIAVVSITIPNNLTRDQIDLINDLKPKILK
jgi:DnaJ-class molecular chaperone